MIISVVNILKILSYESEAIPKEGVVSNFTLIHSFYSLNILLKSRIQSVKAYDSQCKCASSSILLCYNGKVEI